MAQLLSDEVKGLSIFLFFSVILSCVGFSSLGSQEFQDPHAGIKKGISFHESFCIRKRKTFLEAS